MGDILLSGGGSSGGGGGAVTVADGADVAQGAKADAAWDGVAASATEIAILKKIASSGTGGGPATIADGADITQGALADAAVTTDVAGTLSAKLRGLIVWFTRLAQLHNTIPNPTYSLQIGGAPVDGGTHRHVGASTADPASGDVGLLTRNISGMGSPGSAAPGIMQNIAGRDPVSNAVRQVEVYTAAPSGTEGGVITRNIPSGTQAVSSTTLATEATLDTRTGSLTEAAPATDTASSGLNGRLQRVAQRITSLIALLPSALVGGRFDTNIGSWLGSTIPTIGVKVSASSIPVVLANDYHETGQVGIGALTASSQTVQAVSGGSGTASITLSGVWSGTVIFFGSDASLTGIIVPCINMATGVLESSTTANGTWLMPSAGWALAGVISAGWISGTASVAVYAGLGSSTVQLVRSLPTGTNVIGSVNTITGQTGVQGSSGVVTANTQRMVIATDQTAIPISTDVKSAGVQYLEDATGKNLTQTAEGRLRVESVDLTTRRLIEQQFLELMEQDYRLLAANEQYSGSRAGFELR